MASPFFFVKKKDGKLRPCQDYQYLNNWTVKNAYPLPLISEIMDKIKGAKFFTKFDVRWSYNNVRIKAEDQWKAVFKTNRGLFEPTVMFFGMCNSPATFQAMMDSIFSDMIEGQKVIVYMDDILIFAENQEELQEQTKQVLQQLWEHDLFLKPKSTNSTRRLWNTSDLSSKKENCQWTRLNSVELGIGLSQLRLNKSEDSLDLQISIGDSSKSLANWYFL
jgi:Reverse transcriptase (RNA-dependent DNA polymerase)